MRLQNLYNLGTGVVIMASEDIYGNKKRYERFLERLEDFSVFEDMVELRISDHAKEKPDTAWSFTAIPYVVDWLNKCNLIEEPHGDPNTFNEFFDYI